MRRVARVLLGAAVASLFMMSVAIGEAAAAPSASAACTKATDIEAIIDDSGSMAITDPNRLRVQAMDLLINSLDSSTSLGSVEFGGSIFEDEPSADTVFPPEPVGPNAAAMKSSLDQKIDADNGTTDYNAAFAQSDADNPGADARIFLTDGGHDVGTYNNGHLVHRVPTYVIGFSSGTSAAEDQARLQQIAADTGGRYFPLPDSSALQAIMEDIEAVLTCQTQPRQFTDLLKQGQSKRHSIAIGAATKAIQIALTWTSPLDKFKISGLKLVNKGHLLAIAARRGKGKKPGKLKVKRTVGSTYTVLKISNLHKGQLSFAVKAVKVGSGEPKASLTTQVSQSSHK
jgi:hypothetical protein